MDLIVWVWLVVLAVLVVYFGSLFLLFLNRHRRQRANEPDLFATTWCEGCDQIRLVSSMAWNDAELYRCSTCRGVKKPEPYKSFIKADSKPKVPKSKTKPKAKVPDLDASTITSGSFGSATITGRNIELPSVAAGQKVVAQGGRSSIHVTGDVGEGAALIVQGGSSSIIVDGYVNAFARLVAQGGAARIAVGGADATASLQAQGGGSEVIRGKRRA